MKYTKSKLFSMVCFGLLLVSFQTSLALNPPKPALKGQWTVQVVEDKEFRMGPNLKVPSIHFSDQNKLSGNTGCNSFSGNYQTMNKSGIALDPGALTRMYCEGNLELEFLTALKLVNTYELQGNTLLLKNGKNQVMRLIKVVSRSKH